MSEESVSDLSVSEGNTANVVFQSQIDQSISQCLSQHNPDQTSQSRQSSRPNQELQGKPVLSGRSPEFASTKPLLRNLHYLQLPRSALDPPPPWPNPNTFDNSLLLNLLAPQAKTSRAGSPVNYIKQNKLLVKSITSKSTPSTLVKKKKLTLRTPQEVPNYREALEQKLEALRNEQQKNETEECSFKPAVIRRGPARSHEQLHSDLLKFQKRKAAKLEELREEALAEPGPSFQPYVSEKSRKLLNRKSYTSGNCFERLYSLQNTRATTRTEDQSLTCSVFGTNTPKITQLWRGLSRVDTIDERLYNDALRRRNTVVPTKPDWSIATSPKSLVLLTKSFLKEFATQSKAADTHRRGALNYTQFVSLFKALQFVQPLSQAPNEEIVSVMKIWRELGGDSGCVSVSCVKVAVMGIMGYYQPWMSSKLSQAFVLTESDTRKYHCKHRLLFKNRTTLRHTQENTEAPVQKPRIVKKTTPAEEALSVEPVLNDEGTDGQQISVESPRSPDLSSQSHALSERLANSSLDRSEPKARMSYYVNTALGDSSIGITPQRRINRRFTENPIRFRKLLQGMNSPFSDGPLSPNPFSEEASKVAGRLSECSFNEEEGMSEVSEADKWEEEEELIRSPWTVLQRVRVSIGINKEEPASLKVEGLSTEENDPFSRVNSPP